MNTDEYYEDEENIIGMVLITAYKDNTYFIKTDMSSDETTQLVVDVGDDLLEGNIAGFSHGEISNEIH